MCELVNYQIQKQVSTRAKTSKSKPNVKCLNHRMYERSFKCCPNVLCMITETLQVTEVAENLNSLTFKSSRCHWLSSACLAVQAANGQSSTPLVSRCVI